MSAPRRSGKSARKRGQEAPCERAPEFRALCRGRRSGGSTTGFWERVLWSCAEWVAVTSRAMVLLARDTWRPFTDPPGRADVSVT